MNHNLMQNAQQINKKQKKKKKEQIEKNGIYVKMKMRKEQINLGVL